MFGLKNKKNRQNQMRTGVQQRSTPIMRYYSSNKDATGQKRTERVHSNEEKSINAKTRRFVSLLPQRMVFIVIIGLLLLNTTLSSSEVAISDESTSYRPTVVYDEKVDELFNASVLHKSKFTFSSDSFEREIISAFPEVSRAVAVVPIAGRQLQVYLEFVQPLVRMTTTDNQEGVIGEGGVFVFLDTKILEESSLYELPILILKDQPQIQEGTLLLTSTESNLIRLLRSEFDGSDTFRPKLSSITFDVKKREMEARFKGVGYYAKLTPERDAREGVGSLVAILKDAVERKRVPKEYIDVRVEDRVFIQ
jgi:hypothetical protein